VRSVRIFCLAVAFSLLGAASAQAQPVLILDGGKVRRAEDPHLPRADLPAPPRAGSGGIRAARQAPPPAGPAFRVAIRDLFTTG